MKHHEAVRDGSKFVSPLLSATATGKPRRHQTPLRPIDKARWRPRNRIPGGRGRISSCR
jgi:hypothetical protein